MRLSGLRCRSLRFSPELGLLFLVVDGIAAGYSALGSLALDTPCLCKAPARCLEAQQVPTALFQRMVKLVCSWVILMRL